MIAGRRNSKTSSLNKSSHNNKNNWKFIVNLLSKLMEFILIRSQLFLVEYEKWFVTMNIDNAMRLPQK